MGGKNTRHAFYHKLGRKQCMTPRLLMLFMLVGRCWDASCERAAGRAQGGKQNEKYGDAPKIKTDIGKVNNKNEARADHADGDGRVKGKRIQNKTGKLHIYFFSSWTNKAVATLASTISKESNSWRFPCCPGATHSSTKTRASSSSSWLLAFFYFLFFFFVCVFFFSGMLTQAYSMLMLDLTGGQGNSRPDHYQV